MNLNVALKNILSYIKYFKYMNLTKKRLITTLKTNQTKMGIIIAKTKVPRLFKIYNEL